MGSRRCCRGSGLRQRTGPAIGRVIRWRQIEEVRFAADSPVEGDGFEHSVPRERNPRATLAANRGVTF